MRNSEADELTITINDIIFVIVLFKTNLVDSTTFTTLKECVRTHNFRNVDLVVYDNSPIVDLLNKDFSFDEFNLRYIINDKNYGVSYCYNRSAAIAMQYEKKYLILLDQDTKVSLDFIPLYIDSLNKWKGFPVYAPKLVSDGILFSPCNYKFYKGSHIRGNISGGIHRLKGKNVLNSGLAISVTAFEKVGGYEESVQLYFSDFVFFNKLKVYHKYFVIMDCILEHNLSSVDYTNSAEALKRFELYVDGAISATKAEKSLYANASYFVTILGRSVLMSIRLKNMNFLKVFLKAYSA